MARYGVTNKNLQFDILVSSYCIVFRGVHQYKTVIHSIEIMVYTSQTLVRLDQAQSTLQKLKQNHTRTAVQTRFSQTRFQCSLTGG